jgi:hypothetical protein
MEIIGEFPPNIGRIRQYLSPPKGSIFAYNNKIYNPDNVTIWPDLEEHEKVHFKQQERGGAELWWERYIQDSEFRLEQEVEAYGRQYKFYKERNATNKELKGLLFDMANGL